MTTMIIKQEVQATPKLVAEELQAYAAKIPVKPFPFKKGAWLKLKDHFEGSCQALPGMPVLVVGQSNDIPRSLGLVAMYQKNGMIVNRMIDAIMVDSVWPGDPLAPPAAPSA